VLLRSLCKRRGICQSKLASMPPGIDRSYLSKAERGLAHSALSKLLPLARSLGLIRRDPAVRGDQAPDSSEIKLPWLTSTAFYRKMCSAGTIQSTHSHSGPAFLYDNRKSGPVRRDSRPGKESSSGNKLRQHAGRRNQRGECRTGISISGVTRELSASTRWWTRGGPTLRQMPISLKTSRLYLEDEQCEYLDPELYDPDEETLPPGEMELIFENSYVM
jgi:hypothetical protein